MKMIRFGVCFCFLLMCSFLVAAQEKRISFEHLTTDNGLSNNYVRNLCKDYKGYMWFVGYDVCKYDGYNFTVYKPDIGDGSYRGSHVNVVTEDKKHRLWFGTTSGMNLYNRSSDSFIFYSSYFDLQAHQTNRIKSVTSIAEDKKGILWVTTIDGLLRLDNEKNKFILVLSTNTKKKQFQKFTALVADSNGNLWIGADNGNIIVYNPTTKESTYHLSDSESPKSPVNSAICQFFEDSKKRIWIATEDQGLEFYDKTSNSFVHFPVVESGNGVNSKKIYSIVEDRNGTLWLGTDGGGIILYHPDKKTWRYLKNNPNDLTSVSSNGIYAIYIDNQNIVWVSSVLSGIDIYNPNKNTFNHYWELPAPKGLSNKVVSGFYEDDKGMIYIATDKGGLNIFNPRTEEFTHFMHNHNIPNSITSNTGIFVKGNSKGDIWVGTWGGGLNRFEPSTQNFYSYLTNRNDSSSVYASEMDQGIAIDKHDNMWLSARNTGLIYYNNATQKFTQVVSDVYKRTNFGLTVIKKILLDKNGNLWLGTDNEGLVFYDTKKQTFRKYVTDEKNPQSIGAVKIRDIYEDSKGRLWIGTHGGGLNLMDRKTEKFTRYGKNTGLIDDNINSILEDNNGNLWLGTAKGMSKFNLDKNIIRNYDVSDGLQGNQFTQGAAYKAKNGMLYFGGSNGFNCFHPEDIKDNIYIPPVEITKLRIFNQTVSYLDKNSVLKKPINETKEITFSYKESVITFEYAAINYTCTSKNKYAYILEGFEAKWNYVDNLRQATYTNLDAGTYTFRVKACNNDGIWNEKGTSIKIIILPPWWKTLKFYLLSSVFVIGVVFSLYFVRITNLKRQKTILEQKVEERTAELQETNILLEERQEQIMQQNEEIVTQSKFVEKQKKILEGQNREILFQKAILEEKNGEISLQKAILENQNEHIKSSIRYAKTIQEAMLPTQKHLSQSFENFIIYKPKDIVSGDFYWYLKVANESERHFIAAVDCTGHGVPGAFMSMIGYRMLTEIILQRKIYEPQLILEKVHKYLQKSLHQEETSNDDGMDICLCILEKMEADTFKITFSGAKRPLFYFEQQTQEVKIVKGGMKQIGGFKTEKLSFEQSELILKKGDILYLSTDGYTDQNNEIRQSLGLTRFTQILNDISTLSMTNQKEILEKTLAQFQGNQAQRDDITIIGIKL